MSAGEGMLGALDAIRTLRSVRRFRPDPIPDDALATILEAATRAPSGGNGQPWQFIVLRDPELKRRVGAIYEAAARSRYGELPFQATRLGPPTPVGEAPLLILVCRRTLDPPIATSTPSLYASIYPAVQNLLIAARALGIGGALTTMHIMREAELKPLLGIPDDVETCALLPLGYPRGRFGPTSRRPWTEVTFLNRWGQPIAPS